ncbi:hypothetical protein DKL61_15145 [Gammaproteobacteria bacterium ESL0073]|nr:hypothetical protein DKL61_15145 [Gammaproteobacteria bacterium ESL0073]
MLRTSPLLQAGLTVRLHNEKLIISPKEKLTEATRLYIKEFKNEIINELTPLSLNTVSKVWLAKIATILNVPSDFLIKHAFIDKYDLTELIQVNPLLVANSIKTNPRWTAIAKPKHEAEQMAVIEDVTEPMEHVKANPCFNSFIDHLMRSKGSCCYAPAHRYCGIGQALKTAYEDGYNTS